MRLHAMFWFIDRWRSSTAYTDMSLEEQGAYRNLLDEAQIRGGVIPDEERILEKACGDVRAWKRVRKAVLARFTLTAAGWRNETLDKVLAESVLRAEKQRRYRNKAGNVMQSPSPSPSPYKDQEQDQNKPTPKARRCAKAVENYDDSEKTDRISSALRDRQNDPSDRSGGRRQRVERPDEGAAFEAGLRLSGSGNAESGARADRERDDANTRPEAGEPASGAIGSAEDSTGRSAVERVDSAAWMAPIVRAYGEAEAKRRIRAIIRGAAERLRA